MWVKHRTLGCIGGREGSGVRSSIFTSYVTLKKLFHHVSFSFPESNQTYLSSCFEDQMRQCMWNTQHGRWHIWTLDKYQLLLVICPGSSICTEINGSGREQQWGREKHHSQWQRHESMKDYSVCCWYLIDRMNPKAIEAWERVEFEEEKWNKLLKDQ